MSNAAKPTGTKPDLNANEGEGSKTAGKHYDDAATQFAKSGKVDGAAKAAEEYVEANPAEAAAAEQAGKKPLGTTTAPKGN